MHITCLPSDQRRVLSIFIDDLFWRNIHEGIFGKKPLFQKVTDFSEWEIFFTPFEYQKAYYYSIKQLSFKSHLSNELRKKLTQHLVSPQTIEKVIKECEQLGYLNDHSWIKSYIKLQIQRRSGPQAIAMKLKMKGISSEIFQPLLEEMANFDSQAEIIKKLLETRYRTRDLTDFRERQKIMGALYRKGFSSTTINNALASLEINSRS